MDNKHSKKSHIQYTPEKCGNCGQTVTYILAIDKGTTDIVKAVAKKIGEKGLNIVHPRKEMEGVYLTSNQVGNLSRARFHGLIASVKGQSGNYLLTKKGGAFLRGEKIDKYAIINKATKHQVGYFEEGKHLVGIKDFLADGEYWEGINYEITEGEVFTRKESLF